MASATQVRRVLLQLSADDGDTEAKLDAIAAKADELAAKHPELAVRIETAAASAKLRAIRDELKSTADATGKEASKLDELSLKMIEAAAALGITRDAQGKLRDAAGEVIAVTEAESRALKHLRDAALEAAWAERELDKYQKEGLLSRIGSGIKGGITGLPGTIASGLGSGLDSIAGILPMILGVLGAVMALGPLVGSLASGLLAAGAGVAAFGAVAIPNLTAASQAASKVQAAQDAYNVSIAHGVKQATAYKAEQIAIGKAYAQLSPAQVQLSQQIGSLQGMWQKFVQANTGAVSKVLGQGIGIVGQLLPWLQQFANVATPAIGQLLSGLSKFIESPNFQGFMTYLSQLSGPVLQAIGSGMAGLTIRVFSLLEMFSKKDVVNAFNIAFRLLGATVELVQGLILEGMQTWDALIIALHKTAVAFDHTRHTIADFAHNVAAHFDEVRHDAATWAHDVANAFDHVRHATADLAHNIAAHFDEIRHDIAHWVADARHDVDLVVRFFEGLPGRVVHGLSQLAGDLKRLGEQAISGLWQGLQSKVDGLIATASGWGHDIVNALGAPFGVHFSEPSEATQMIKAGHRIAEGLDLGLTRGTGGSAALAQLSRLMAAHPGAAAGGAGYGGGVTIRLDMTGVPPAFRTWLKKSIRITGGNVQVIGA